MPKLNNVEQANRIRNKPERNDKYYTPTSLVRIHLSTLQTNEPILIYEPFKGTGNYYNLFPEYFPNAKYDWTEIDEGRDFFNYCGTPDIIVSNPPFSILAKVLERLYALRPRIISLLLLAHAVTPCRLREANEQGYYISTYHLTRVDRWFGVAVIMTLSRDITENCISFDCTKHILHSQC